MIKMTMIAPAVILHPAQVIAMYNWMIQETIEMMIGMMIAQVTAMYN